MWESALNFAGDARLEGRRENVSPFRPKGKKNGNIREKVIALCRRRAEDHDVLPRGVDNRQG